MDMIVMIAAGSALHDDRTSVRSRANAGWSRLRVRKNASDRHVDLWFNQVGEAAGGVMIRRSIRRIDAFQDLWVQRHPSGSILPGQG
jgi:hypothetical protein